MKNKLLLPVFSLLSCMLMPSALDAQDASWNGSASTDWSDGDNWSTASVPTGTATFNITGGSHSVNVDGATSVGRVSFGSTGDWTFDGSPLTVTDPAVSEGSRPFFFESNASGSYVFNNQVIFSDNADASGESQFDSFGRANVDFVGGISGNSSVSGFTLRTTSRTINNGTLDVTVSGGITNVGAFQWSFTNSSLTLTSASSVSSETLIAANNVTLGLGHDNALGTGDLKLNGSASGGAAITLQAVGADRSYSNTLVLNSGYSNPDSGTGVGVYAVSGEYDLSFTGNVTVGRHADFVVAAGRTLTLSGDVTGGKSIIKSGEGTMVLSGASIGYSGNTTVTEGTLLINGDMPLQQTPTVTVTETGILGGTGTIARTLEFTTGTSGSGTLSPGDPSVNGGIGTLSVLSSQGASFSNDTQLVFDFGAGGDHDLLSVSGDLILDGVLNVNDLGLDTLGTYNIATYTGTLTDNGLSFGTMPAGWSYSLNVDEAAKAIQLSISAIPEHRSTGVLLALGTVLGVFCWRLRRRR